jgi:uncharacterized iron-regulated protein
MKGPLLFISTILLPCCFLSGCLESASVPAWVSKIREPLGQEEIFRLPQGQRVSFTNLLSETGNSRVIFLGETHDQIHHHEIELGMIEGLRNQGKALVIGMEMFGRAQQPILDRWTQGGLTQEGFLKEVRWNNTWGMDYELYKPILDDARGHGTKVLALNIEHGLVRHVAERGVKGLAPEERLRLPEMDLGNAQHRAYIKMMYGAHTAGASKEFENFYEAQCLWDEAMAESIADFLQSSEGRGKTVLVLCGSGHIAFDFGIPGRLHRRTPVSYKTIVLKQWAKEIDEDMAFKEASVPLAGFLWVTRPNPPERKRPKIGIIFERRDDQRLVVERVLPVSPGEKAGLRAGDELIAVEGIEIKDIKEVHHALAEAGWGKTIHLTIIRGGVKKEVDVALPTE